MTLTAPVKQGMSDSEMTQPKGAPRRASGQKVQKQTGLGEPQQADFLRFGRRAKCEKYATVATVAPLAGSGTPYITCFH